MRVKPQREKWFARLRSKRAFVTCCLPLAGTVLLVGCNQAPSEEELGEIRYSLPQVPGAEKPFQIPPPLTRKPKADADETSKDADSAIPAADHSTENLDQQPAQPETTPEVESPLSESE